MAETIDIPTAARRKGVHARTIWRWIREGAACSHAGPPGHGFTFFTPRQFAALPARQRLPRTTRVRAQLPAATSR